MHLDENSWNETRQLRKFRPFKKSAFCQCESERERVKERERESKKGSMCFSQKNEAVFETV